MKKERLLYIVKHAKTKTIHAYCTSRRRANACADKLNKTHGTVFYGVEVATLS